MKKLLIVGLAASFGTAAFAQNLLTNPGFETGDMTGWTVVNAGNFSGVNVGGGVAHSGSDYFGMGATSATNATDFYQDVATTVGQQYTASFWAYDIDPNVSGFLNVTFGGTNIGPVSGTMTPSYAQYSGVFTATSSTTRLEAKGWEAADYVISDDYSVTANSTPEPASMAVLGIGALALIRRRRATK